MHRKFLLIAFASLITLIANLAPARADDTDKIRILVYKADEQTARVAIGSHDYRVPVSIEIGLGWDDVKDAYELPPAYIAFLKQGRIAISITCSGTSFTVVRRH